MTTTPVLNVVGLDPSLRNWGIAKGTIELHDKDDIIFIEKVDVIQPLLPTSKRASYSQNTLDLMSSDQLAQRVFEAVKGADLVFAELPHGSQSSRAMTSYGVCLGILGALRQLDIPLITVSAYQVKTCSIGSKTASKEEMISWATTHHPEAKFPTYKSHGLEIINAGKAEHMADAIAAIHAGIQTPDYFAYLKCSPKLDKHFNNLSME